MENQLNLGFNFIQESAPPFSPEHLEMPDADVIMYHDYFKKEESDTFFNALLKDIKWRQDQIKYYGKIVDLPRLTAWYGDAGMSYTYSNIPMIPDPWTPTLLNIKNRIELVSKVDFNSVLLNLYRSGRDGVSWHRDNESELGKEPIIASVSFGQARRFQFKHRLRKDLARIDVELTHGSLLIMKGKTQECWLHQIPKTSKPVRERINLTFRVIG